MLLLALRRLERIDSRVVLKNPYWEYRLDHYTYSGGQAGEYHFLHTPGAAMIVPVDDSGEVVVVKQFRYLCQRESIEFPAGGVKDNDYLLTARNELAEEAQFAAENWDEVGEFNPYNGVADEICKVYLATKLSHAVAERDPSEEFEILKLSLSRFDELIEARVIWDGMTLAAWSLAKKHVSKYLKKTVG